MLNNFALDAKLNAVITGAYESHDEKEQWTSVPILYQITLQNAPYKDYKLLVLISLVPRLFLIECMAIRCSFTPLHLRS